MALLISPEDLFDLHRSDPRVRVIDVRWRLDKPDGHADYLAGHVPGAVFVDLDTELAAHGDPADGRHPLPPISVLQAAARRWGVEEGDTVVAYDDWSSLSAARAWWMLRQAGLEDVRVLDGGIRGWVAAGLPTATDEVTPKPGDVTLHEITDGVATIDDAAAWPGRGVLLDVRGADRYRGENEVMDPRAGHIPGAVSLPSAGHVHRGKFVDPDTIRANFAAAGVVPGTAVAAYCGSGITAAHTALAGALAGIDVTVFPGSFSAWANHPELPVATGEWP